LVLLTLHPRDAGVVLGLEEDGVVIGEKMTLEN
jgi:hypothetical protein